MMQVLKDIGGVELPETLVRFENEKSAPTESAEIAEPLTNGEPV